MGEAIEGEELAEARVAEDLAEAEPVQEVGIFRGAAAVETGVHLEVDLEGSADQAHAPAATGAPPAWDLEVWDLEVAAAPVAVDGGGRHGRRTEERCNETNVYE